MCGIIGYTGPRTALPLLVDGLKRLEYRGYDSAGVCVVDNGTGQCSFVRAPGRISELEAKLSPNTQGTTGIAHTRWATHGEPTEANAHPHTDSNGTIYIVHNGIVENYADLKEELVTAGHTFTSDTDSETLPHLIEEERKRTPRLADAVAKVCQRIRGTFGLVVIAKDEPQTLVAVRRSSPLIVGVGNKEHFIASDASALLKYTKEVIYLNDDELVEVTPTSYAVRTLSGDARTRNPETIDWSTEEAEKEGHPHFMHKEIFEGPATVVNATRGRLIPADGDVKLGGLESVTDKLRDIRSLHLVACGTAGYAARVGQLMIEEYAKIPTRVTAASEFRYRDLPLDKHTAVLAISQSGETADTLAAVKEAKARGLLTLGLVNVVGSTIARETKAGVYNHAGPEIGVASTKAYLSQLTVLALLAVHLGRRRRLSLSMGQRIVEELTELPGKIERIIEQAEHIKALADRYAEYQNFLFVGRKYNFPTALEGALKLKEISYRHAEGYAGGELKHGPLALVDDQFPTVAIATDDSVYEKMISNLQEIKSRKGPILAIATEGDENIKRTAVDVIYIPKTLEMLSPILSVVPLHLFAYYLAARDGRDVDHPRNLAKSVTVE